jgi:hypothetical protein
MLLCSACLSLQVGGDDVTELHFKYYPDQERHASFAADVL